MSNCTLTGGIALACLESIGGVKNVYISAFDDASSFTLTNDVITAATMSNTSYTFKFRPQTSALNEEGSHSLENGTNFWTQTVNMIFHKMETAKRNNVLLLAGTQMHVIVETQNGEYWLVGMTNGAYLTASTSTTGQAYGDLSGYTISITGLEPKMATEMDAATFGTLTIAA
jgi:hypothetical protein